MEHNAFIRLMSRNPERELRGPTSMAGLELVCHRLQRQINHAAAPNLKKDTLTPNLKKSEPYLKKDTL